MAGVTQGRYVRTLVLTGVLIGGLWALAIWRHSADAAEVRKACAAASPSPSPSPTGSPTARATGSPSVRPTSAGPTPAGTATPEPVVDECDEPGLFNLGLDLQGGISITLQPEAGQDIEPGSLDQAVEIIRNRVDALGVAEPDIAQQGENIVVQIAGIKENEQGRAFELIGTTAKLQFRPVLEAIPTSYEPKPGERVPDCADPDTWPEDDPKQPMIACVRQPGANGEDAPRAQWGRLRLGPVRLEGTDVSGASAQFPPPEQGGGQWTVSLSLTGEGAKKFETLTGELACNRGQDVTDQLAIVLDRVVESHPGMGDQVQCRQGIPDGSAEISGGFTESEAKDLSLVLRYGALPVELEPVSISTVSPTLGRESLRSGLIAALIGIAIVFFYVLLFYRALGLIIWLGIAVHAAITFAVIVLLGQLAGFSLTLAGIAGLIVSLGIAADSFIVYFERIKDEVATGKTVRAAVERAWPSARRTIVNADIVTALAAFFLYFLAVGGVRGFALMLGLSTALDLFVSFWVMHPAVSLLARTRALRSSKTLGIGGERTAFAEGGARA